MDEQSAGGEGREKLGASTKTVGWFELGALIVIGLAFFFILSIFFHWFARTYDLQMLEIGRRANLANILAAVSALLLTNLAAKLLGIKPSKSKIK